MSEKIQYAGEVNFDTLEILTSGGLKLDILDITVSIDIFEDIFKNTITGSLVIGDTENILSNFKIVGQELLRLKIRTPGLTEKSDILDFTANPFFINNSGIFFLNGKNPLFANGNETLSQSRK